MIDDLVRLARKEAAKEKYWAKRLEPRKERVSKLLDDFPELIVEDEDVNTLHLTTLLTLIYRNFPTSDQCFYVAVYFPPDLSTLPPL